MSSPRDARLPSPWTAIAVIGSGLLLGPLAIAESAAGRFADPTRPPQTAHFSEAPKNAESAQWTLGSVLISPERRIAIVNGKSVQPGDRVGGAQVLSITNNEVTLRGPRGTRVLILHPDAVKRDTEIGNE